MRLVGAITEFLLLFSTKCEKAALLLGAIKPLHQFHYAMHGPLQCGESAALKTTNLGLIQSFVDANEWVKWMCLSALG